MGFISKALVASGLVVVTGPFSFMATAQEYVDVEGEKEKASGAANPYGASPAQSYPATSYGTSGTPAGAPVTATGVGARPAATAACIFLLTDSSVSPKNWRRSEWPIMA